MDYTALHEVTETIIEIIKKAVDATNNWLPTLRVVPEQLKDTNEGIGFYLFHVQENSHFKNFPGPGKDSPPVNYTPMALNLFYQLSANKRKEDNEDAYDEQRLMSVAMKALHDNANITKTPSTPLHPDGKKINLNITLHTLTPSESVQYWAAGDSAIRLSAYYEVSVVFMEPEVSKSYTGRVLSYGNYVFVKGAPQIIGTENTIAYQLPGDPVIRQVKISPAQAPPAAVLPAPAASVVSFLGTGFGGDIELLLINARWKVPAVAAGLESWEVSLVSEHQLDATVRQTALLQTSPPVSVDILPGLYGAQVVVTETKTLPGLGAKKFRHTSNQFPFSVMPRIDSIVPAAGVVNTLFTVTGYLFQHPDMLPSDIQAYAGEDILDPETGATVTAGHFKITGTHQIKFKVASTLKGLVAIRILIKGVESAPNWITVS